MICISLQRYLYPKVNVHFNKCIARKRFNLLKRKLILSTDKSLLWSRTLLSKYLECITILFNVGFY